MTDWDDLVASYLSELRARQCSHNFCRYERRGLKKFTGYCQARQLVFLSQVRTSHLQQYYASLCESHKAITCYGLIGSARRYLKWATYRGHLMDDPGLGWQPRLPPVTSYRSVPTESQMVAMLEAPNQDAPQGQRDQVLLEFLYGVGLRVQECADVELPDLDLGQAVVTVRLSKGGDGRVVPLGPRLTALLDDYLATVRPLLARQDAKGLFVDDRGQSMRTHTIQARVRTYSRQACDKHWAVHSIRHAYATHLLIGGAPPWALAKLLGHKCIGSTTVYTKMLPLDVEGEVKRTHPRAQRKAPRPRPPKSPE